MHQGSLFATSSLKLVICFLFDNNHSDIYELISYCVFDFRFPGHSWCLAYFHISFVHSYVFFGNVSIQILCFVIGLFAYLILNEFLAFFEINHLPDISFADIICHSISCLFILMMVSFTMEKHFIWCGPTCLFLLLFPLPFGEGKGNPLQYSCLGNEQRSLVDLFHEVAKSQTWLSD